MKPFYRPAATRVAQGGPITYHSMAPHGGTGRTDGIVASFAGLFETARSKEDKVRIVGHSLGAVVAWALAHEWTDVVDTVELWCAPLRGTGLARLFQAISAEARFLLPGSRWLASYDRPLNGPVVRSMYTACDLFVLPPRRSSYVSGERAENHFLCPAALARPGHWMGEHVHDGVADHVLLPRHPGLLAAVTDT
jgi:pimeloyl-ACP methyl ester carboxylesterase